MQNLYRKTWKFVPNFIIILKHTPSMHNKLQENHPTVNCKASKGQEKQKWTKKWSKRRRFLPKVDPKGGMIDFELRTTDRERAVGKGRVGVNPYRLIWVWSWGSTRSEAKGLGGFQSPLLIFWGRFSIICGCSDFRFCFLMFCLSKQGVNFGSSWFSWAGILNTRKIGFM